MAIKYAIRAINRTTKKQIIFQIVADSRKDAVQITIRDYGHSYDILEY
jgi:hypothetical protein